MRKFILGVLMSALMLGVLAAPATANTVATQRFTLILVGPTSGTVIATGPITGIGTSTETEGQSADTFTFTFSQGVVNVDLIGTFELNFNPRACIAKPTESGTFTITGGSGTYKGVTGGGTFSGRGTFVGARDAQGQCPGPDSGTPPAFSIFILRAVGTANVPTGP